MPNEPQSLIDLAAQNVCEGISDLRELIRAADSEAKARDLVSAIDVIIDQAQAAGVAAVKKLFELSDV